MYIGEVKLEKVKKIDNNFFGYRYFFKLNLC